jgi:hypothetical protein
MRVRVYPTPTGAATECGPKIMPERIKEDRDGYEAALTAADQAWDRGQLDFSKMEEYLAALVQAQLADEGVPNPGPVT